MASLKDALLSSLLFTCASAGVLHKKQTFDVTSVVNDLLGATAPAVNDLLGAVAPITDLLGATVQQNVLKLPITGPQAYQKVHSKYNATSPRKRSPEPQVGSGSIATNPTAYDAEYICSIPVGGQIMNLDLDTGSSDFWVFSPDMPASSQSGHHIYYPTKSTTSKKIAGATWSVGYGDGASASGTVYNDTVTLGKLSIPNQAVEAASAASDDFTSDPACDGMFGLAFKNINTISPVQRTNPVTTAFQQKLLSQNLFTADLKKGKPGTYDFGFINSTKYTGSLTYSPVDSSQGYWTFTAAGWGVGSAYTTSAMSGIADTGTSLLVLPDAVVNGYWAKVPGSTYDDNYGAFTFPCTATLPTFTLGIGTAKYTLPGPYLNYGPVSSTMCYGGLQSSNGMPFNIFGDIFLKGVFVVFDASVPRIGFATKNL